MSNKPRLHIRFLGLSIEAAGHPLAVITALITVAMLLGFMAYTGQGLV